MTDQAGDATPEILRILLLEDDADDAELQLSALRHGGLQVEGRRVETEQEFLAGLTWEPDVVLADYRLPRFDALSAIRMAQERAAYIPVVVVSGAIGEDLAVEAMKAGATDYLLKDRLGRLSRAVTNAIAAGRLARERDALHAELEAEFQHAAVVQARLLPHAPPQVAGYEFAGICLPARQVGGDFFDWSADEDSVRFSLGDVMGKGVAASLLTAMVRAGLRSVSQLPFAEGVAAMSRALSPDLAESNTFITLFHAELEPATGVIHYVDAGHGMAFIQRGDGGVALLAQRGLPLGILADAVYHVGAVSLEPGDTLLVYSDGLPDARPNLQLDPEGVARQLTGLIDAQAKLERLVALSESADARQDDFTLLIVRRQEAPSRDPATLMPRTPSR